MVAPTKLTNPARFQASDLKNADKKLDGPVKVTPNWQPSPPDSPVLRVVIEHVGEYKRSMLADVLSPEQWKIVSVFGEVDRNGNPREQAMAAFHIYVECNLARTVDDKSDALLMVAEKTEWERFLSFSNNSKFGIGGLP